MKKLFCITLIGISTLFFIGCGNNNDQSTNKPTPPPAIEDNNNENQNNGNNNSSNSENDNNNENNNNSKPNDNSNNNSDNNSKPNDNSNNNSGNNSNTVEDKTERIFKISTKDIDYNVVSGGEVKTVGLGVADNIKKILETTSKKYFDNKPLELSRIDTINNKKIAVVNLAGDKDYWHQKMQGSAGGAITEYTLIENILQRSYKGYWIDGVKFTINGNPVTDSSHSPNLSKTTYR